VPLIFAQLVISLNLVLAGLRLGLKNRQVGEKWVSDDYSYLYKGFLIYNYKNEITYFRLLISCLTFTNINIIWIRIN
jgi:hypothetical protein